MNYEDRAVEYFLKGYNCAQSVAAAFSEKVNLPEEIVLRLSCAFGGGYARKRNVCGAVSGMGIVLGLLFADGSPDAKKENYKQVRRLCDKFENEFGSIICSILLGESIGADRSVVPEEHTQEYYKKRRCKDCVRYAARLVAEEIEANEKHV